MIIIDIPLNDDLKKLGVTEFKKQGQSTLLLLYKNNKNSEATAVIFPISKDGPYDTLMNFESSAKSNLDRATIEKIKVVLVDENNGYLKFLLFDNRIDKANGDSHATNQEQQDRQQQNNDDGNNNNNRNNSESQEDKEEECDYSSLQIISVSDAARLYEGPLKVQGVVSAISPLRKLIKSFRYICKNCDTINEKPCVKWADGKPELYQTTKQPMKCIDCKWTVFDAKCEFINAIIIELRNTDTFSDIDPLLAVLFDQDTKNAYTLIGERVVAAGRIHIIPQQGFSNSRFAAYLYVKSIKYESNIEVNITKHDIEAIERITRLGTKDKEKFPRLKGKEFLDILTDTGN